MITLQAFWDAVGEAGAHALRLPLQTFKNLQYAWFIHTLLHIHIHNYNFTKC
jgi:hypothetical protein